MSNFKEEVLEYFKQAIKLFGLIGIILLTFWLEYKWADLLIKANKYEELEKRSINKTDSINLEEGYKMIFVYPEEIGLIEIGDELFVEDIIINNSNKTVKIFFGYVNH
jgi:hypothetical protein